jgi:hypothetical protein
MTATQATVSLARPVGEGRIHLANPECRLVLAQRGPRQSWR